jgi:hypothetical protein
MAPGAVTILRERLLDQCRDALARLAEGEHLDAGLVALVGHVGTALDALDVLPADVTADRIVFGDDGRSMVLTTYTGAAAVASVPVSPRHAIALAGQLLDAALRHLPERAV